MASAVLVKINNIDRTSYVKEGSISVSESLGSNSTMNLVLIDPTNALQVQPGQTISLYLDLTLRFAGSIDRAIEVFPSMDTASTHKETTIRAVDWNQLTQRRLITEYYERQAADDIIKELASRYLSADGITTTGVQSAIEAGPFIWSFRPLRDVFNRIANAIGYQWRISYDKDLKFQAINSEAAPFNISDSSRNYAHLSVERGRKDYRNVQVVRGGLTLVTARLRQFAGDGTTTSFSVDAPIGAIPTIQVDGVSQTIGIIGDGTDNSETGPDWFWQKGTAQISQNTTASPLTSLQTLSVTYQPLIPIIMMTRDPLAIADRKSVEGGSGIYEAITSEEQVEDEELASTLADAWLRKHAVINTEISVTTYEVGFHSGQIQNVDLTAEDLDDDFLIISINLRERGTGNFVTTYKAINNEAPGGWADFYRRLAQSGAEFTLGASETAQTISQVGDNVEVSFSDTSTSGYDIHDRSNDPYTNGMFDSAEIGCKFEEDGTYYSSGSFVGEYTW